MDYDKDIKIGYFVASVVLSTNPCWLFSLVVMSQQTTAKVLTVRNGDNTSAPIILKVYASLYDNPVIVFNQPIYFNKGLYLEFGTNIAAVTVQYKPEY
ncbi:hypothetical protein LCGC14_0888600 [marine sediment metagenome]|uniref:Uncharacterized protein n=1 Tax=marine sediment metagenome TaxID=412755 RepID=A0A0F9PKN8_9ZZZZ